MAKKKRIPWKVGKLEKVRDLNTEKVKEKAHERNEKRKEKLRYHPACLEQAVRR